MAVGATFTCEGVRLGSRTAVITAAGDLDIEAADLLRSELARLRNAGPIDQLVIDLTSVAFIDSSGMGVLVGAQRLTPQPLRVVAPEGAVRRALHLTNLDKIFRVSATRSEALDGLQAAAG